MKDEFDYEAARRRFPAHWDREGRPASKSTWRSVNYPQLRVQVRDAPDESGDVRAFVFWEGSLDQLRGLFAYETDERWNIDKRGLVYGAGGIDREGRWREWGGPLEVTFERAYFGGPDTLQLNFGEETPFFEPVEDWDNNNPEGGPQ